MEIKILPRRSKKNQGFSQQLWIKEGDGLYKVYKNTEHTVQFSGPPNNPFQYTMAKILGNLTIDYKPVSSATEKTDKTEYINKKFYEPESLVIENAVFDQNGKYYLKICGYCKEKPAKLRILLQCNIVLCEMVIQFASDALIKSLRKKKMPQIESDQMTFDPPYLEDSENPQKSKKRKASEFGTFSILDPTSSPDVNTLLTSFTNVPIITVRSPKGESTVMPTSEMPLKIESSIYKEYQQDIFSKLDRITKLHDKFVYVVTQANELLFTDTQQKFDDIKLKLDDLYRKLTFFACEQAELTLPYLFDRQSRLSKIGNELYDLQEKLSEEDKRISTHRAEYETPFF